MTNCTEFAYFGLCIPGQKEQTAFIRMKRESIDAEWKEMCADEFRTYPCEVFHRDHADRVPSYENVMLSRLKKLVEATAAEVEAEWNSRNGCRKQVQGLKDVTAALKGEPSSSVIFSTDAESVLNSKMRESTTMTTAITELENAYCDAAAELRSKQTGLQNHADELHKFIGVRDKLQEHPDFSGYLPETYFSGGELDPVGVARQEGFAQMRP